MKLQANAWQSLVLSQSLVTHQKLEFCSLPDTFGRQVPENFLLCGRNLDNLASKGLNVVCEEQNSSRKNFTTEPL
jgi:hypothetical protein